MVTMPFSRALNLASNFSPPDAVQVYHSGALVGEGSAGNGFLPFSSSSLSFHFLLNGAAIDEIELKTSILLISKKVNFIRVIDEMKPPLWRIVA
jgi:hypothetical protein